MPLGSLTCSSSTLGTSPPGTMISACHRLVKIRTKKLVKCLHRQTVKLWMCCSPDWGTCPPVHGSPCVHHYCHIWSSSFRQLSLFLTLSLSFTVIDGDKVNHWESTMDIRDRRIVETNTHHVLEGEANGGLSSSICTSCSFRLHSSRCLHSR